MNHRTTASFGKRQEYVAVGELLKRGFDVYMTLVDDQQIDCVIRQKSGRKLRYLDIQIKARSDIAKHPGTFAALSIRNPRPDFWFIFYSEPLHTYWVMSSLDVIRHAHRNKGGVNRDGKNKGKLTINFVNRLVAGFRARPKFKDYENAFHLLEWDGTTGSSDPEER